MPGSSASLRTPLTDLLGIEVPFLLPMLSGQSVDFIHDLSGAGEVIAKLVAEARQALARIPEGLR